MHCHAETSGGVGASGVWASTSLGKNSIFYIDEEVFCWEKQSVMADKMAELSNKVSKAPFPCLPYRGYNVLGAGFDLEADNYSGWGLWPGGPARAFGSHQLPGIKKGLKKIWDAGPDHQHFCRGVGVLLKFLEHYEALVQ